MRMGVTDISLNAYNTNIAKAPAWMLHGTIVNGRKGPALFWEKEWRNINSANYDEKVLSYVQRFLQEMLRKDISSCKTMPLLTGLIRPKSTSSADRFPLSSSPLTRQILILLSTSGIG